MKQLRSRYGSARGSLVPGGQSARYLLRLVLILAIVGVAFTRGYSVDQWIRVAVAVLWAASLPLILTGLWRYLKRRPNLEPWHRRLILVGVGVLLIGSFFLGARSLIVL